MNGREEFVEPVIATPFFEMLLFFCVIFVETRQLDKHHQKWIRFLRKNGKWTMNQMEYGGETVAQKISHEHNNIPYK